MTGEAGEEGTEQRLCDRCRNYADKYLFCRAKQIKIGRNLVCYCMDHKERKGKENKA